MSISDRLDEIQDRYGEWYGDRGRHTPAPDTVLWRLADHPDESMDHCIVREDVPEMLAALRAVLDLHPKSPGQRWVGFPRADRQEHYCMADQQAWPCDTHRTIAAALGEGS